MEMVVVKLKYPIKVSGVERTEVALRRPKVRDRLIVDKVALNESEKEVLLMANLAELPKEAIEDLDLADYARLAEVLGGFLVYAPEAT
jgi:hypothetical protein